MSSHCGRYPGCGCSKSMGTKCHLPNGHTELNKIEQAITTLSFVADKLFMAEFRVKIKWYTDLLHEVMKKRSLEVLPAALLICDTYYIKGNEFALIMVLAATVEIIEQQKNNNELHSNSKG